MTKSQGARVILGERAKENGQFTPSKPPWRGMRKAAPLEVGPARVPKPKPDRRLTRCGLNQIWF